ncbi:hypothetical protein [Longimicrobium sp.]|jgi:hypothetical protein|uniref:hypothetical protein n=1 Tax=Longimicrobium sp. TaxID=2029185 RepID=UPI002ED9A3B2
MVKILFVVVWGMGVNVLAFRLRCHFRNRDEREFFGLFPRGIYVLDFFRPDLFTEEGERVRRQARNWFIYGGLVILLVWLLPGLP